MARDSTGHYRVERHTASFLIDLSMRGMDVAFMQPEVPLEDNGTLHDGDIPPRLVRAVPIRKRGPVRLLSACLTLFRADFVYLYFPGTLPRLIARICNILGKPYGIYLRGEKFDSVGADQALIQGARFICTVAGLDRQVRATNPQVIPVQPMLDIGPHDAVYRSTEINHLAPIRLLFVGRLAKEKGVSELLEAASMLRAEGIPFQLNLIGGGPMFAEIQRAYGDGVGSSVRVRGLISDKAKLFHEFENSDVLVMPSHHEGFPRVLYEAMLKSNAIITTFVGGISELMVNDVNCIEVPRGDPYAIADAIRALSADRTRISRLGNEALRTALRAFAEWPTHVDAVLRELRSSLSTNPPEAS